MFFDVFHKKYLRNTLTIGHYSINGQKHYIFYQKNKLNQTLFIREIIRTFNAKFDGLNVWVSPVSYALFVFFSKQ